jgi:hypothetical protein
MPFVEIDGIRLLFVHVPKAAGSSVEAWMRQLGPLQFWAPGMTTAPLLCTPQHFRRSDLDQLFDADYFTHEFAIVRDPYRRLVSEYKMRAVLSWQHKNPVPMFGPWLEHNLALAAHNPWHLDNHFRPQWEFVGDRTRVFRIENGLKAALDEVGRWVGRPAPKEPPRRRATDGFERRIAFSAADVTRVRQRYAEDFARFGYDPEDVPEPVGEEPRDPDKF